ncbi:RrF2 family transcriptional regulator [Methylorubrum extorquens]|uniref:Transcriptional regulator, BadM/Rrf2 family n=1 Tax=Methylorubrum extorquens (strain CM4 / NCIMB 13688) TaxID=440085 RepID=B7KUT5_METC4|nr:Rrf2 family transcriptional regulator [Methylorubrum extorquens]ACK84314.1 transcriptional regulator, BadM/Rrf2 family [Methylorubrum extorquens CM4]
MGSSPPSPEGCAAPLGRATLHLSLHTDYGLRLLMHLTLAERGVWVATPAVAQRFDISVHHLQKIAQTLVRAGVVEARQGRSGGVRLARDAREIRLGRLVADLEGVGTVADCRRDPCPLLGRCRLKWAFDAAEQAFFLELDRLTLADVVAGPTAAALRSLFRAEPGDGGATPAAPVPTDPTPSN